jgi:carbon monoxide dehydrogenase subunit G
MPSFEQSVEIDAPVAQVFEFVTMLENWPKTNPSITTVRNIEQRTNGSRAAITYRMVGINIDGQLEVEIRKPMEHVVNRFTGPGLKGTLEYHLTPVNGGTELVQRADYELTGSVLDKVIEPVAAGFNRRQFEAVLKNTKELIEAQVAQEA